ncbi:hypothetical protein AOQ84DRAFT_141038 [Glonium stellatum]|uniref:Uncharacterized protein n=1 Tax=Glonium stellatum TaxID=574774 RepID=A0A8E2ESB9_9PEZI|nr:hypothetical protein AOQ84DRAFT_141038 [Glonium stellatum]
MRNPTLHSLLFFLLALLPVALAQDTSVSTFYMTRTVYRVITETQTGTPPSSVANTTSTLPISYGTILPVASTANYTMSGTGAGPTVVGPTSTPAFTGAASHMNVNGIVAGIAVGVGYVFL